MNDTGRNVQVPSETDVRDTYLSAVTACALLVGLYLTSLYSYTLFHSLVELFSIVIAFGIFVIAWNARALLENNYLLFIGIAYLFIGGIDLVHTLAYKGMGVFKTFDANHPTQLWIAARSLQSVSLLLAPFFIGRRMNHRTVLVSYAVVFSLLLWSILYADVFPDCYREGVGLTPFKKVSEYAISTVLVASGVLILRKKSAFEPRVLRLILLSLAATVVSELAFTFYVGVYDLSNLMGHIFKIAAFYSIYAAIIKTGLRDPYELIFRRLQQSQTELQKAKAELELRVEERTCELARSNELLRKENVERAKSDEALLLAGTYNRSLIEASLDPLVTIGSDGTITDVNAATEEVTGCTRGELIGADFSDYFTEPEKAREGYQQVFHTGQVRDYPLEIKRRDGHITPVLYNATVYRDAAGKVIGVFAAARDITERRKAEEETRRNLARQKALLDLYQKMAAAPVPDIISFVVDKCVNLTGSAIGFVGLISDDGQFMEAHLWPEKAMEACTIGKPSNFPLKEAGIWAEPIRQRKAMIVNDYRAPNPFKKGYPQGHLDLSRFMGIPVIDKDRVVVVAGVANKRADYTESDQNKVSLLLEGVWDLIKRKRAEESLRISEEQLRAIFDNAVDGILLTDLKKKKFYTGNKRICAMLGYTIEELMELGVGDIHPPESLSFVLSQFEKQSRREITIATGIPVRKKDGSTFYADINSTPVTIGGRMYLLGIFRDITERRQAETALQASEQRFRHLVESVTDYIYTVKVENGRPVSTIHGPGCVAVTGYRAEEYEADPYLWHRMIYEEDRKAVVEQATKIMARAEAWPLEHRIIHKNGGIRWVKNTPVPRYDEGGVLVSYDGLISDVTERKKLEDQLRQAQKMEAIGQLAGGIAHDFNNILSAIIGYGHILHMKMKEDDPLRMNVDHLLESADRAAHLTHSLLAFSRKQIINPVDVNLNEIIQRIEKFLRRIIGEDIELKTISKKETATVHADSSQIEQVFMNLATNARDAMERGGCLTIETDIVELDDSFIRAHGYGKLGSYVLVSVTDTGRGMDAETQKRIFEPFFTTKEEGRGTGLGLAMVYGIIKQHNGYINVYSEPGSGATFNIYLPLVTLAEEKRTAAPLPEAVELPRGTETILLAEDDDALRKLSLVVLSEFGYTVIESSDGQEAIDKFMQNREKVGLLLLDMIMPKKSGREVYEFARKVRGDIKVVFVSGYTADKIFTEGLLEKGAEVMQKPVSPQDLLKKIRKILDRK